MYVCAVSDTSWLTYHRESLQRWLRWCLTPEVEAIYNMTCGPITYISHFGNHTSSFCLPMHGLTGITISTVEPLQRALNWDRHQMAACRAAWLDPYRSSILLARVLNLTPFACTTVMEMCPVFPVLISLTIPDLPACVPPITLQFAPSFNLLATLFVILLIYTLKCHQRPFPFDPG